MKETNRENERQKKERKKLIGRKKERNKAVYTAASVACGWAVAV